MVDGSRFRRVRLASPEALRVGVGIRPSKYSLSVRFCYNGGCLQVARPATSPAIFVPPHLPNDEHILFIRVGIDATLLEFRAHLDTLGVEHSDGYACYCRGQAT